MPEREVRILWSLEPRPEAMPPDCLIWNAPRPLAASPSRNSYYTTEWQGTFRHGIFYAVTDPRDRLFLARNRENAQLDAWIVRYANAATCRAKVLQDLFGKYGEQFVLDTLDEMSEDEQQLMLLTDFRVLHENDTTHVPTDR